MEIFGYQRIIIVSNHTKLLKTKLKKNSKNVTINGKIYSDCCIKTGDLE